MKKKKEISFTVSPEDDGLIHDIVDRVISVADKFGLNYPRMDAMMDLTACQANGCPLRLADLLKADDFNFCHDIFGIRNNLNRTTGKLENCFLPRFAKRDDSQSRKLRDKEFHRANGE